MIFTYQYINHDIEKFQEYLDFLFYDVWMVAEGEFNIEKLNGNPELKRIYEELGNVDYDPINAKKNQKGKSAYFFNSSIKAIYDEFEKIKGDNGFKRQLIEFYRSNNDVESLCSNKAKIPITYPELIAKYPDLGKALYSFYSKLYGNESPFNLDIFGKLNDVLILAHYKSFMIVNDDGICPFCGIYPMDGINDSTREAYDHYLPKSLYPFNSINFKNLSPMCNKCNSGNKSTNDPIEHISSRKLAFYPYSKDHPEIEFEFKLLTNTVQNITPSDFTLSINAPLNIEEVETWNRVFNVKERYNAMICNKHEAKEWFTEIYEYYENAKTIGDIKKAEDWYERVIRATTHNPRLIKNTIKRKFLEECMTKGLFNTFLPIDPYPGV